MRKGGLLRGPFLLAWSVSLLSKDVKREGVVPLKGTTPRVFYEGNQYVCTVCALRRL